MKKQILLSFFIAVMTIQALAQANEQLSNLINPTAVNRHLFPNGNSTRDLGSTTFSWRDIHLGRNIYLDGIILMDDVKFVSNQGTQSTFVGLEAGNVNTSSGNSGFGYRSLFNNISGSDNTANGANALRANTNGSFNTGNGSFTLYKNSTGNSNTANGYATLYSNSTGSRNVAIGNKALYSAVNNSGNVAIGDSALYKYNDFSYDDYMVAIGQNALTNNTTGFYNTACGSHSLLSNNTGTRNTAHGALALQNNTTGSCNTAVGFGTLGGTTGSNNTAIGCQASILGNTLFNATAVGSGAIATSSNQVMLGNTAVTSVKAAGSFVIMSDGRFKNNRKENVPGLEFIKELKPVTYNYNIHKLNDHIRARESKADQSGRSNDCCQSAEEEAIANKEKKLYTGFVAQEVEVAANKLGYNFSGVYKPQNDKDAYGLSYSDFVVPLVKAVQELSAKDEDKDKQIEYLQKQLDELKAMINIGSKTNVSFNDASIEQNTPNPFNKTTTIKYSLPQKFTTAQIIITDKNGKTLKQQSISGSSKGTINIEASTLVAGAYNYSLIVDGRVISSKQMVLTK
jgi:hypothetical protein